MYHKILVIQTAYIGDVILALPLIQTLKQYFSNASIDVVVKQGNGAVLNNHKDIRKIWVWQKSKNKIEKYKSLLDVIKQIRSEKYDIVFNLHRFASSGLLTFFSNAKIKIGFDKNPFAFIYTYALTHKINTSPQEPPLHEVQRNISLITPLIHFDNLPLIRPQLYPTAEDFVKVKNIHQNKPYIVIAPCSVWFTKQLGAEKWHNFLLSLHSNLTVMVIGAKNEYDYCQKICVNFPNALNLAGQLSLLESAALMQDAQRVYCNDSAPLHLASAMNAPVTVFFGSTAPFFGFGPLSDDQIIVERSDLTCKPCGLAGKKACPQIHFDCGNIEISPELDSQIKIDI